MTATLGRCLSGARPLLEAPHGDIRTSTIAQESLIFRRRKFADPMILTSTGWCPKMSKLRPDVAREMHTHRFHFGEGCDNRCIADNSPNERPEQTTESAVNETG